MVSNTSDAPEKDGQDGPSTSEQTEGASSLAQELPPPSRTQHLHLPHTHPAAHVEPLHPAFTLSAAHAYPEHAGRHAHEHLEHGGRHAQEQEHRQALFSLARPLPTWEERKHMKRLSKSVRGSRSASMTPNPELRGVTDPRILGRGVAPHDLTAALINRPSIDIDGGGSRVPYVLTPEMLKNLLKESPALAAAAAEVVDKKPGTDVTGKGPAVEPVPAVNREPSSSDEKDIEHVEQIPTLDKQAEDDDLSEELDDYPNPWARFRPRITEFAAEFIGTGLLICFGNGVNNQVVLSTSTAVASSQKGEYLSISWGWGIGVMVGVYVAGGISGGHINPAVTLALAVFRKFPWWKVPIYWAGQVLGAMVGSALVYLNYVRAVELFEGGRHIRTFIGKTSTADLYSTYPLPYMSTQACFYEEVFITAILIIVVFAITDKNNMPPPDGMNPVVLMFLIVGIGACLGMQTAYALNPARDIGPRLVTWFAGYGGGVWTFKHWYWLYTPTIATLVGGVVGGFIYDVFLYTGGDSPINARWTPRGGTTEGKKTRRAFPWQTKRFTPAGTDKV